jgi:ribose transport system ATP-binding protein
MRDTVVDDLLTIEGVSKRYPGTQALRQVSMSILPGEIHALAGQNGAGKSTLIRILAGVEDPDKGAVSFRGQRVRVRSANLPINFIHQDSGLFPEMTVAENFALSVGYPRRGATIAWRRLAARTQHSLDALGCEVDPTQAVAGLSPGQRSLVAIARAMATEADIIVLDEPTAALPVKDVETLFAALRRLRDHNVAVLYVTHRLDEVFQLADRVTVLRDGTLILTQNVAELTLAQLVEAIVGRPIERFFPTIEAPTGEVVVGVDQVTVGRCGPVSFQLRGGEVLGLVGLRGAGQDEIGRGLFGVERITGGAVRVGGSEVHTGSVTAAMRCGIGFVSSRRAEEGLGGTLTVRENLFYNPSWVNADWIHWRGADRSGAKRLIERFGIVPPDPERVVLTLSGGNQQKVLVARWIQADCRLLILEEPTAGVDVGARTDLYGAVAELCRDGRACLLVSSDFDEVAGLAHRALVFDRGRIIRELSGSELTGHTISLYASGSQSVGERVTSR